MSQKPHVEFEIEDQNWFPVPFDGLESGLALTAGELRADGPGRELEEIFSELGISYQENCGCRLFARRMDAWGVAGCREHFNEIVDRLRKSAARSSFQQRLSAGACAVRNGLAFSLNPLDPFPGLVREAIRRAEADEVKKLTESSADGRSVA